MNWRGSANKSLDIGTHWALVYLTIKNDYSWQVHRHIPRVKGSRLPSVDETLIECGRTATEAESIEAAEKCLRDTVGPQRAKGL